MLIEQIHYETISLPLPTFLHLVGVVAAAVAVHRTLMQVQIFLFVEMSPQFFREVGRYNTNGALEFGLTIHSLQAQ